MAKSTRSRRAGKPAKPYADYPLFAHDSGRWAKKIRGKLHYFGRWGNKNGSRIVPVEDVDASAQAAVDLYDEQREDLYAGRTPRRRTEGAVTIKVLVNDYLNAKRQLLDAGEITARTFGEYFATGQRVADAFGSSRAVVDLTDDFGSLRASLAETRGPVALGNEIQRVRMIFKWGYDQGLIEPIRYGQSFNKPSAKAVRKARAENGSRMFHAHELRRILDALDGDVQLKAMTLLAINCGFGQWDVACLPETALDLDGGWATFPRPKTGIPRRAKLWPETVKAVRAALAVRPAPKEPSDAGIVFINSRGKRWVRASAGDDPARWTFRTDLVGHEFAKVLRSLDINGRRGFYAIRHSFQTAAEECRDLPAVRCVMGHGDSSMSGIYRESISDARLETVAAAVHAWLFPPKIRKRRTKR